MKKRFLFGLLLGTALISSCSDNDDVLKERNKTTPEKKEAYLSLKVNLPQAALSTKAGSDKPKPGEDGDGKEVGTEQESKIDKLIVYGFNGGNCKIKVTLNADQLEKDKTTTSIWSAKDPIPVAVGNYRFYVIANPSQDMDVEKATLTESTFKDKVFQHKDFTTAKTHFFPMSTADEIGETVITAANTKTQPALLNVNIQRMFGKVLLEGFVEGYDLKNFAAQTTFAKEFKFTKYGIVNQRKEAYIFRRVGTSNGDGIIGKKEEANKNYVIDPAFDKKTKPFQSSIAEQHYWDQEKASAQASYWKNFDKSGKKNLQYVFENTMKDEAQLQGYTTGLVLEAQFTPKTVEKGKNVTSGNTFYEYEKKYYADLLDLKAACAQAAGLGDVNAQGEETARNQLINLYKKIGVTVYYKGKCYYHYWIRHANNGDPKTMGIMEFGIVRNNVYKMKVNSIKGPGSPTPPVTPDRPDEDTETFLDITVHVLPWVIRENSMDL